MNKVIAILFICTIVCCCIQNFFFLYTYEPNSDISSLRFNSISGDAYIFDSNIPVTNNYMIKITKEDNQFYKIDLNNNNSTIFELDTTNTFSTLKYAVAGGDLKSLLIIKYPGSANGSSGPSYRVWDITTSTPSLIEHIPTCGNEPIYEDRKITFKKQKDCDLLPNLIGYEMIEFKV